MISVMCVEDDPDIQLLYKGILGNRDFKLRIYHDGSEAITGFVREPPDLVLLDIEMPGLSGLETCRELRKIPQAAKVPIIMVSSKDTEDIIIRALSGGADDYILKPFKPAELLAKVNYSLKRRQAGIDRTISLSFSDKYEIVKKIDDGSQTSVYYAHDTTITPARDVALKVFKPPESEADEDYYKSLFLREAYEWSKLKHRNIVSLYDFGQSAGSYYLVLEYISGKNLWNQVEDCGPLAEQHLILIAYELTEALEYIDTFNIVHRDIKPNNILISNDGDIKLTDFGLAKQKEDTRLTIQQNVFKGTPDFVSPEQIEGTTAIDIGSDIYSLGATLYYAATGCRPFQGKSIIETLNNHFSITPKAIHEINPLYGAKFSTLISRALIQQRSKRPSILELKSELKTLL